MSVHESLDAGTVAPGAQKMSTGVTHRRVLVTVGTDHHPFDRIVTWFDAWMDTVAARDDVHVEAFVQRSTAHAGAVESVEYLSFDDLVAEIKSADIVVTHGGPGSIVECRKWGRMPVVVPRDPALGEHVDNHQQLFSDRMAADGQILIARTEADFRQLLDDMVISPATIPPHDSRHVDATVDRIGRIVGRLVSGVIK